jgi:hypothetical protein
MDLQRMIHRPSPGILSALIALLALSSGAETFDDINVQADAMYSGNTFHGYAEMRVSLENHSATQTHVVTLVYPNTAWGNYGNNISRLSRTVTLAPHTRAVVPLFQPPLPVNGDRVIRVEVDRRHEGEIRAPNGNNHCNYNSGGNSTATAFISRSLDFDAVGHILNAGHSPFSAAMATGPPDASSRGGWQPNTWMPDQERYNETNWLELEYKSPQPVQGVSIHSLQTLPSFGYITLTGVSGTNLARIPLSSGHSMSTGSQTVTDFSFPVTGEPVKTVRLNFEKIPSYNLAIDAVAVSGPGGTQWAADARASSDNSASASSYSSGSTANMIESLRAEMPVAEWSENWLAYTPFDMVVLQAGDLATAPPLTLAALWNYVQAGGSMVVFGNSGLPEQWRSLPQKRLTEASTEYAIGLGRCLVYASENPARLEAENIKTVRDAAYTAARYWQSLPHDSAAANTSLPVVDNLKIPIRGIVFIMLLFVLAIGPVNIGLLSYRKRRTWMLWTIPAISVATTLLVFAYSLLREGVTPNARMAGLTLLDQAGHSAATVGVTGFYCPLTPSSGLQFDSTTEATPLVETGYGSGTEREVDWSQSQHLGRGWISARVPAHFHLRKSEPRRERLQVIADHDHWQVLNGLGAPIQSLWLADSHMQVYQTGYVAAGQKAALTPVRSSTPLEQTGARMLLDNLGYTASTNTLGDNATRFLTPHSYIAVLDGNPFVENALGSAASARRTHSSAVVFGILGADDMP